MPNLLKTEAIVLRKRSLLGQDNLITFFTKEHGKVNAIAKGIKKTTSRRAPHLQTANLVEITYNISHERKYLDQSVLKSAFSQIKNDMKKMNYLYLVFFILDRLLPEDQIEEDVYKTTMKFLVNLSNNNAFDDENCAEYLFRILSDLGYVKESTTLQDLISTVEETINEKVPTSMY